MCPVETKPAKKPESKAASIPDWKTIELPPDHVLKHREPHLNLLADRSDGRARPPDGQVSVGVRL